ncbi:MAG: hypothetical protein LBD31_10600 [Treponema sp.]|nr:hypothetical protein [Treponema sp.]
MANKAFAGGEAALPISLPLYAGLAYIYNGLPGYEIYSHTLLPLMSLKGRWAGIALGPGFRFTEFFGEPPVFESMISFSAYVNFLDREKLRLGLRCANFNNFNAGNMGAYFINLNSTVYLTKQCALINEFEILQSGSVALSANFYGIVYRGGVVFTW